jgi:hypothetical protein
MKKVLIYSMFLCILFYSCENKEIQIENFSNNSVTTLVPNNLVSASSFANVRQSGEEKGISAEMEENYGKFAKALAKALENESFRSFIKTEAMKKFDGDYDILVESVKNVSIDGKDFKSYFEKGEIERLLTEDPRLNIALPLHIDKWDVKKNKLLVAVLRDEDQQATKAFDSKGKQYFISQQNEPDVPVIVAGYNERTDIIDGKAILKKMFKNSTASKSSKNLRVQSCTFPYRQNNQYEYLLFMKYLDLGQYEGWLRGAPETVLKVYAPTSANNFSSLFVLSDTGPMEPADRWMIDNMFWPTYAPLFMWDSPNKAKTMLFNFWELDDSGATNTFSIGLGTKFKVSIQGIGETEVGPNLSYSVQYRAKDKEVGRWPVEQFDCPPISGNIYQIGTGFQFIAGNYPF